MPQSDRQLARDDCGTQPRPVLDDFEEICRRLIGKGLQRKVIEHENVVLV